MILENIEDLTKELSTYFQDRQLAVQLDKANLQNEIIIPTKPELVKQQAVPDDGLNFFIVLFDSLFETYSFRWAHSPNQACWTCQKWKSYPHHWLPS